MDRADFQTNLQGFVSALQDVFNREYATKFPMLEIPTLVVTSGRKYAKVVRRERGQLGSVYCFVEKDTGDVYKAATWSSPYTNGGPRSNIGGANYGVPAHADPYGSWLYKNR